MQRLLSMPSYLAVGLRLSIETNSESILQIAHATFQSTNDRSGNYQEFRLRLWVEEHRIFREPANRSLISEDWATSFSAVSTHEVR